MRKVNLQVIRPWVVKKVIELVGFEDEVVVEYAMGLLEDDSQPVCCHLISVDVLFVSNLMHACDPDSRPPKNANKSNRFSHK